LRTHKLLLIIALLFISMPLCVAAFTLTPITLLDSTFKPVEFISPSSPILVELYFNYTLEPGETFNNIFINATDIFPGGIYSGADYSHLEPVCTKIDDVMTCSVNSLTMKTSKSTVVLGLFGTFKDAEINEEIFNTTTFTFTVDKSNPYVIFMGTKTCYQGQCYIASGVRNKIEIQMEDERATFDKANVGYKIGSQNQLVDHCEGMTCYGTAKITCTDNQKLLMKLRQNGVVSKDDTGNKISSNATTLICDSTPPTIDGYTVTSATGTIALTLGDNLVFDVNTTDEVSPVMSLTVDANSIASGNVTGTCSKPQIEGSSFNCRASIKPGIEEPGKYKVNIIITDVAGRTTSQEFEIELLKTVNDTVNLWKIESTVQSTNTFSRTNLDYARTLLFKLT
jgi:hypothetical protein